MAEATVKPDKAKNGSVSVGTELTPNDMWQTMSIQTFGITTVITQATNAGIHSLVRTVTQKAGEVIHTSMTVVPNYGVKEVTDAKKNVKVVFTRGV